MSKEGFKEYLVSLFIVCLAIIQFIDIVEWTSKDILKQLKEGSSVERLVSKWGINKKPIDTEPPKLLWDTPDSMWYDKASDIEDQIEANLKHLETSKLVAQGACVDKVLSVLSILDRKNKLDDTIFVAVGGSGFTGYHAQCVQVDKDGNKLYLNLEDNGTLDVVYSESDFEKFGMDEEYMYASPDVFIKAAEKYKPDLNYTQFRDFYMQYNMQNSH